MLPRPALFRALFAFVAVSAAVTGRGADALRPLAPIVDSLVASKNPDMSELGYVAVRGAAVYSILSTYADVNARDGKDKEMAAATMKRAEVYYAAAQLAGVLTKKSKDSVDKQFKTLADVYTEMVLKSKELNNTLFSPAIIADMDALEKIEPAIAAVVNAATAK